MRTRLPVSLVRPGHQDYGILTDIAAELERRAGGVGNLAQTLPRLLRDIIDNVIQTPRTGRRSYDELEKTEKTYIGTQVEIVLRDEMRLPKGRLDTVVLGHDVDIKHTIGNNWMIPTEALDCPCILVAADEDRGMCYLGLIVARMDYLTSSQNRDAKRSVSADGFAHILWIVPGIPYPPNFWRTIPKGAVDAVFQGETGNDRVCALFREVQGVPVSRDTINAVAKQKDFMRRIRADGGRGTRDRLAREGILLLSGTYDAPLIRELGLPIGDFISYRPTVERERALARAAGWDISWQIGSTWSASGRTCRGCSLRSGSSLYEHRKRYSIINSCCFVGVRERKTDERLTSIQIWIALSNAVFPVLFSPIMQEISFSR